MSEKDSVSFRHTVTPGEAASFLEALAKSLREGSSLLESGESSIGLQFGPAIKVELDAESDPDKGKGSIEFSLRWRGAEQVDAAPSLVIVPGALVPTAAAEE